MTKQPRTKPYERYAAALRHVASRIAKGGRIYSRRDWTPVDVPCVCALEEAHQKAGVRSDNMYTPFIDFTNLDPMSVWAANDAKDRATLVTNLRLAAKVCLQRKGKKA